MASSMRQSVAGAAARPAARQNVRVVGARKALAGKSVAPAAPRVSKAQTNARSASSPVRAAAAPMGSAVKPVEKTAKPMNIVVVSTEVAPWSKTGGLGDVVGALPIALAARGHKVMPRNVHNLVQLPVMCTIHVQGREC